MEQAHAYAYGGCIIQDLGYYPFSSRLFSDLTHYVRSGDFITALIRDSQDINEYAFALGALEHYAADTLGHRIATNRAVPILYPKLRKKFGSEVTYWDNPVAHVRTEFGFDVLQVASGRYATDQYRSFIGFQVARPLLERAFLETYGIEMKDIFGNLTLALGSYRYSIGSIVPGMTRVAWDLKRTELQKEIPGITRKKFLYNLSRSSYEKELGDRVPEARLWHPVGDIPGRDRSEGRATSRRSRFRMPTPEVEKMFMASFNATIERYRTLLASVDAGHPEFAEREFRLWANRRWPASTREPMKPTRSWWESWRTSSSPASPRIFARISWPIIKTPNYPFPPKHGKGQSRIGEAAGGAGSAESSSRGSAGSAAAVRRTPGPHSEFRLLNSEFFFYAILRP